MFDLIKVAIRNVGRNKRRTLITILTVFIGVVVSVATRGLLNGLQDEIKNSLTRKLHGDLQIHRQGYQDSLESNPYKLLIPADAGYTGLPYAPRLKVMGLVNHQKSQTTTPVMIAGIDSRLEAQVCPRLAGSVQAGRMMEAAKESLLTRAAEEELGEAGGLDAPGLATNTAAPRAAGDHQIMMTPSLQRGLGAEIGDELVVLISDRDNMQQAVVTRLVGIVDVATPGAVARMAWMDLTTLQKILNVEGQASEIALRIPETMDVDKAKQDLMPRVPEGMIVETWLELGGILRDAIASQNVIFSAVVAIMFAIVIAAIVNTSLMTVMERTREIGTLMALGYRRRHILLLFLTESAVIGGVGGLLGAVAGVASVGYLHWHGLVMKLPGQTIATELYPSISIVFLVMTLVMAVLAALISGLIPAFRASHLKPVEALSST